MINNRNKSNIIKIIWGLLAIGSLLVVGLIVSTSDNNNLEIELNGRTFLIPKENSRDRFIPSWIKMLPGLDDSSKSTLITFHAQDIQKAIPDYKVNKEGYVANIVADFSILNKSEIDYTKYSNRFNDLWYATGSYRDRIIEFDEEFDLFKVYRKIEKSYSWALLKVKPEKDKEIPLMVDEFWVAHCLLTKKTPLTSDGRLITYSSYVMWDDYTVDFNFLLQNIDQLEKIKKYIKAKILEWKKT